MGLKIYFVHVFNNELSEVHNKNAKSIVMFTDFSLDDSTLKSIETYPKAFAKEMY